MQEVGPSHNEIQKDEEVQEMNMFQPNSQDQQSTDILLDISIVDAFHEEIVVKESNFRATNVQLDAIKNKNETQPNSGAVPTTQLMLASTTIGRHADEVVQLNLT